MSPTIKLGFIGAYKLDIIHFLSRALLNLGYSVAIIDASEEQNLRYSIPDLTEMNSINYHGVECFLYQNSLEELSKISFEEFDVTLVDYGFNSAMAMDYVSCNLLFVVTDFERYHIQRLKALIDFAFEEKMKIVKIFRDLVSCKISCQYINQLLRIEEKANVLEEYRVPLLEEDLINRLTCAYDDHFRFKSLSKKYHTILTDIISEVLNDEPKQIERAIKYASEGKVKKCK